MKVNELAGLYGYSILTKSDCSNTEIQGVYVGDLLSRVMAKAEPHYAWITIHTHINVAAVAVMNELSCVILPEGLVMEEVALNKLDEEGIAVLSTEKSAYQICCDASRLGL